MPQNSSPKQSAKPPVPQQAKADPPKPKQISFGLMSLVVGSVAMSLFAVPYSFVRVLSVMVSLGGIGLAVMQFRTNEKAGRNFNSAITGALFCTAVILLTALAPYLPTPGTRTKRPVARPRVPKVSEPVAQAPAPAAPQEKAAPVVETVAATATPTAPETGEAAPEVPKVPDYVPKTVPFPCRKSFELVQSPSEEWIDASAKAAAQGEIAVCVVSATLERPEFVRNGKPTLADKEQLFVRLQVMLVGTPPTAEFSSWGSANFGNGPNKPSLSDNSSKRLQPGKLGSGTKVIGNDRPKSLYPKLYADDTLFFEKPDTNAEYLRLELPAAAFGGVGMLRFQIPKSMIEGK